MSESAQGIAIKFCSKCGYEAELLDALFYLDCAAMLVPMSYDSLRKFLSRRKEEFQPMYFHVGRGRKRRVLTGEEIKRIRAILVRGPRRGTLNDLFRRGMASPSDDYVRVNDHAA